MIKNTKHNKQRFSVKRHRSSSKEENPDSLSSTVQQIKSAISDLIKYKMEMGRRFNLTKGSWIVKGLDAVIAKLESINTTKATIALKSVRLVLNRYFLPANVDVIMQQLEKMVQQ